jgi:hypothetical protein
MKRKSDGYANEEEAKAAMASEATAQYGARTALNI